jgi:DNA-binding IclR family transcriptional regulator
MTDYQDTRQTSQTLVRGLQLLELISRGKEGMPVRRLAAEVGLSRTIVHRLLVSLESEGYLERNLHAPGYRLGVKLWSLGCAAIARLGVKDISRPYLERLVEMTNEMAYVAVLDGPDVVYIDKVDCPQPVRAHQPIGGRSPAFCVAIGKAILAFLPAEEINRIVPSMKRHTRRTVFGKEQLKKQLEEIRKIGFAINQGEWQPELGGAAAPIRNAEGAVIASIGVTGPLARFPEKKLVQVGRLVVGVAEEMSRKLGYVSSQDGRKPRRSDDARIRGSVPARIFSAARRA